MKDETQVQVIVPEAEQMENDIFMLHLEHRHPEAPAEKGYRLAMEAWIGTYRAFHERCHRIATPGQHDHVHEWDEE
jgi:hypothetical protein